MHGRGACVAGKHAWQGAYMAGGMHARQGVCVAKGLHCRGEGMHGRRDDHCSGWYASYWNAFLLLKVDGLISSPYFRQ